MVLIFAEQQTDAGFHGHAKYPAQQQAQQPAYPYVSEQQQPQMYNNYNNTYYAQPQQHQHIEKSKMILAERYKTKMCRTFMATGTCPYHHRCMFAHGQHELRTTDMNVRDGLMTEEAIRSFQRAMTAYNRGEVSHEAHYHHGEHAHHYQGEQEQYHHHEQASSEQCPCDDCAARAAATQHNPYYSAMPQAYAHSQQQ